MNILPREKQLEVLAGLVDGNSERAVQRMFNVNRGTISRLALKFGQSAQYVHDQLVRDLSVSHVVLDEVWSFCHTKAARVRPTDPDGWGEAYTYLAMDKSSRLLISWHVGPRDAVNTKVFVADLRKRLVVMPKMTSDGWVPYISAIEESFGRSVSYAQTVKNYTKNGRRNGGDDHRYEPPRDPFVTKKVVFGSPNLDEASTAYLERANLTLRHFIGRMRRLNIGFSKSPIHHRAAWSLAVVHYNMCHVVKTLRVTPAMQAGITDRIWDLDELYEVLMSATPCEAPEGHTLVHPRPVEPARELPGGRGFLRLVSSTPTLLPPKPAPSPQAVSSGQDDVQPDGVNPMSFLGLDEDDE